MHGGNSPGPPKGSRHALKHGIYVKGFSPEELSDLPGIRATIGGVDEELVVAKIQLQRALKVLRGVESGEDEELGFELAERKEEDAFLSHDGETLPGTKRTTVRKRPDYRAVIDRLLGRIAHLETVRASLKIEEVEALRRRLEALLGVDDAND